MKLDEIQTLKLVQERITEKVYSFRTWQPFITWVKSMTQAKFKAFIVECLDDSVTDGDDKKADLLEVKNAVES